MLCERCGEREANVHMARMSAAPVIQVHLCTECSGVAGTAETDGEEDSLDRGFINSFRVSIEQLAPTWSAGEAHGFAVMVQRVAEARGLVLPPNVRDFVARHIRPPA